jgi:hypothetical protein
VLVNPNKPPSTLRHETPSADLDQVIRR